VIRVTNLAIVLAVVVLAGGCGGNKTPHRAQHHQHPGT
jgi:hypothetical protein